MDTKKQQGVPELVPGASVTVTVSTFRGAGAVQGTSGPAAAVLGEGGAA
ncbi:hypothetical protein [Sinomonas sp.]|jgi:hypothetical protein